MKGGILMDLNKSFSCPKCSGKNFTVKREVTYLYTYRINPDDTEETNDKIESVPFLFDNREKENSNEYIECEKCGAKYPISPGTSDKIDMTILQKAVRSDYVNNPEYLG
jgi:DNA-directed RNA polymerase subunit RPC12/RpoP